MRLKKRVYGKIKKYNDSYFTLTALRNQGGCARQNNGIFRMGKKRGEKDRLYKFDSSISRSKSRIRELGLCNEWEYFLTVTLNGSHDRTDFKAFKDKLLSKLKKCKTWNNEKVKYLVVYGFHRKRESNGGHAVHAHILLSDLPSEEIEEEYKREFGYICLEPIESLEEVTYYLIDHVTNDAESASIGVNKRCFSSSRGLKGAEVFYNGKLNLKDFEPDYRNDFVDMKTLHSEDEAKWYVPILKMQSDNVLVMESKVVSMPVKSKLARSKTKLKLKKPPERVVSEDQDRDSYIITKSEVVSVLIESALVELKRLYREVFGTGM